MNSTCSNYLKFTVFSCTILSGAHAQDAIAPIHSPVTSADELAKKLANPVASLISVPFQNNYDAGIGPLNGSRYTLNVQPVIPVSLNADWNLISRTIIPFVYQDDVLGDTSQEGLSDVVQSLFFSPKAPTADGWIWGTGPVLLLPTATEDSLSAEKWGAGPTAVALKQDGPLTYGALVNHIWSYAGVDDRADVSATFLNPFVTYALGAGQTISVQTESTYDWQMDQWTVPLSISYGKVAKIGPQLVSFNVGAKYYAEAPDAGPDWGLRLSISFLFPN